LFRAIFGVLGAVLAIVGFRPGAACATLALSPCQVPGGTEIIRCGRLEVPENWDNPGVGRVILNIIVLPKLGPGPEQSPMVWLDGGPGVPGTNSAEIYTDDLKFHRDRRAIIMFDQRGTGESGALHCPRIERQSPLADLRSRADVIGCRRALEAHADLAQYSTRAAALDLDAVRSALGYETIDLARLSYGTLLAQAYMKLYPAHVRSAALIGAVPLGEKLPLHHATNAEHTLRQVFNDCRIDTACNAAFPSLPSDWEALQRRLRKAPIVIQTGRGALVVRQGPFGEFIRGMLNSPDGQRRAPLIVSLAARGDYDPLVKAVEAQAPEPESEGLYLSVTCPEATRRILPDEIGPAAQGSSFGRYRIDQQVAACRLWAPAETSRDLLSPLKSDIPVLLLSGGRDATTPTRWAEQIASGLPNSRVLVFEHMTHLPVGLDNMICLDRIMDAFFLRMSAKDLDAGCIASMIPPPFSVIDKPRS
jgi:pimeloyl-ACP methyl ester carboxylesterase